MNMGTYTYIVITLLTLSCVFYVGCEWRFWRALKKVRLGTSDVTPAPKVSVLLVAINNRHDVRGTLDSIMHQDYHGSWDVWVADDGSSKDTRRVLAEYVKNYEDRFHVFEIKEPSQGGNLKKTILNQMADACEGEIFFFTNFGCIVKPTWISSMVREFEPGIEFVAGNTLIDTGKANLLVNLQAAENLLYRTIGTAGLAMHLPITGSSGNLAYRRHFIKILNTVKSAKRPYAMRYCIAEDALVTNPSEPTLKELWAHRKSWATKKIRYSTKTMIVFSMILLYMAMICLGAISSIFNFEIFVATLLAFLAKCVGDLALAHKGTKLFNQKHLFIWCLPIELIHAPFTLLTLISGLVGRFKWK